MSTILDAVIQLVWIGMVVLLVFVGLALLWVVAEEMWGEWRRGS